MSHKILYTVSVLPALLIMPAMAATGGLINIAPDATGDIVVDFDGNMSTDQMRINIASGQNVTFNGNGYSYGLRDMGGGALTKQEQTNYYKYLYKPKEGQTEYLYGSWRGLSSSNAGKQIFLTPDMNNSASEVIDFYYNSKIDFVGRGKDVVYTRSPDDDNPKKKAYAFKDADGKLIWSKSEHPENLSLPDIFKNFYGTNTLLNVQTIKNVVLNADGTYTFTMADALTVNSTPIAYPYIKYTVGDKEIYVKSDADIDDGVLVYDNPTFTDNSGTVTLFKNDDGTYSLTQGGGITVAAGGSLALNDVVIEKIYARDTSGAIRVEGELTGGDNIVFKSNSSQGGGAVYLASGAKMILGDNVQFIDNSIIGDATKAHGGAVMLSAGSDFSIGDNAVFADNYSKKQGGAIYAYSSKEAETINLNIGKNAAFIGNTADNWGGALHLTDWVNVTLGDGLQFVENTAAQYGGAISYAANLSDLNLTNAVFRDNSAFMGGAIWFGNTDKKAFDKNLNITNSVFSGNYAVGEFDPSEDSKPQPAGGAIFIPSKSTGTVTIKDSVFNANYSNNVGGAIQQVNKSTATINVENTDFVGNHTVSEGGAITSDAVLDIKGGVFANNSTVDTNVDNETPLNSAGGGGAIFMYDESNATISGGTVFSGNSSGTYGGAIATRIGASGEKSTLKIDGATFTGNKAGLKGGAIYNTVAMTLTGENVFSGNRASGIANDIYNDGTVVIESGTTTLDGGVRGDGNGTFTVADGATLNMGKGIIDQHTININGTVNADIMNAREYGRLFGDVVFGDNAELNLNVATAGTYYIFHNDNDFAGINAGALFDVQNNGAKGVVISTKDAAQVASENGLSSQAAVTMVGLANAGGAMSGASIAAQNALASGNVEYIEAETAKSAPVNKPIVHSVSTTVQNQILALVAARMSGAVGRSGGDFVTTGSGMWAHGMINRSKMNGAFHGDTRGVAVGVDATFNRKYTFGMGYAHGDTDVHAGAQKTDIESDTLFAYAQYKPNKWFINGAFNYTFADYTDKMNVFGVNISSDHNVDSYGAQLMTGYDFATGVTPTVGARYLHIAQDGYNNGIADITSADTDFMTGVAGVKYAFDIAATRALTLRPELRAAATYDFMSDEATATVLMPGAAAYVVNADRLSRFGGEFGIGMSALYRGVTVSLNYEMDLHKDYTSQTGMLKFRYNF